MISAEACMAFELSGIAGVVENDGVQIAVTGVENVADLKTELRADFLDAAEGLAEVSNEESRLET